MRILNRIILVFSVAMLMSCDFMKYTFDYKTCGASEELYYEAIFLDIPTNTIEISIDGKPSVSYEIKNIYSNSPSYIVLTENDIVVLCDPLEDDDTVFSLELKFITSGLTVVRSIQFGIGVGAWWNFTSINYNNRYIKGHGLPFGVGCNLNKKQIKFYFKGMIDEFDGDHYSSQVLRTNVPIEIKGNIIGVTFQ